MALIEGNEYDHIEINDGTNITRHYLKDTDARNNLDELKSAINNVGINQIIKSEAKADSYRDISVFVEGEEITVNGTASGNVRFKVSGDRILHAVSVSSSWCQDLTDIPAGLKKIQVEIVSGSGTCTVALYDKNANVIKAFGITASSFGTYDFSFESADADLGCLVVYVASGATASNLAIKVRLIDTGKIDNYIGVSSVVDELGEYIHSGIDTSIVYSTDSYYVDDNGIKYISQGLCVYGNNIVISMSSANTTEHPDVKDKFMGLLIIDKATFNPVELENNPIIYDIASLGLTIETSHSNSLSYVQETNEIWCRTCNDSTAIIIDGTSFSILRTELMDFTGGFSFDNISKQWCYLQYRNDTQYSIRIMDASRSKLVAAYYPYRQGTAQGVQYHANRIYIPTSRSTYNSVLVFDTKLKKVVASWYFNYGGEFEDIDVLDDGEIFIVANDNGVRLFRGYCTPYNEYYGNINVDFALFNSTTPETRPATKKELEDLQDGYYALIAPTETTTTASRAYTVGSYLILNNTLYKVTSAIASGVTITPNTNVRATTIMSEIMSMV